MHSPLTAEDVLANVAEAMGGTQAVMDLRSFTIDAQGERWVLDEGFDVGEGATRRGTFTEQLYYDVAGDQLRLDYDLTAFGVRRIVSEIISADLGFIDGQNAIGAPAAVSNMLSDRWASIRKHQMLLNPAILLRKLLANPSAVTLVHEVRLQTGRHHVLRVENGAAPLMVFVNAVTDRLTKVTTMENDELRRDVPLEVRYNRWRWADFGVTRGTRWWEERAALRSPGWRRAGDRLRVPPE